MKHILLPMRVQPPHKGHIKLIKKATQLADDVTILLCNASEITKNNPFFAIERELMLKKSLEDEEITKVKNFLQMPSFESKEDWYDFVIDNNLIKEDGAIILGNNYVANRLREMGFKVIETNELIDQFEISSSKIREMISENNDDWKKYAASGTLHYENIFKLKQRLDSLK